MNYSQQRGDSGPDLRTINVIISLAGYRPFARAGHVRGHTAWPCQSFRTTRHDSQSQNPPGHSLGSELAP